MTFLCFAIIKTSLEMALVECCIFQLFGLYITLFLLARFLMLTVLQLVVENGYLCIVWSYIKAVLKAAALNSELIWLTYFLFGLDFHSDFLDDFFSFSDDFIYFL